MNKPIANRTGAFAADLTRRRPVSPFAGNPPLHVADGSLFRFPQLRWSFNHAREIGPTKPVRRGDGPAAALHRKPLDLQSLEFPTADGAALTLGESLARTCADGFIVLHKGHVVFAAAHLHVRHQIRGGNPRGDPRA